MTINPGSVIPDGSFSVEVGADVAGANSLRLEADTPVLLVRILHRDIDAAPATLHLVGPVPVVDLVPAGGSLESALARALHITSNAVRQFLEWSAIASAEPNRFLGDVEGLSQTIQGDPGTQYFLGYYALSDGQYLEVKLPGGGDHYWSIHGYNHWCEYLPGASAHDKNTQADNSGEIILTIGPTRPSTSMNHLDSLGRRCGVLVCRVLDSSLPHAPLTRLLEL